MFLSFEYDRTYLPAFPVLEMTIVGTSTGQRQMITGLVDSGSDATQIPIQMLQTIGARELDERWVRDSYGIRHPATTYAVQVEIGSLVLPAIEVVGRRSSADEIIVGRDVLNQLIVTLNGLAHVTEIRD